MTSIRSTIALVALAISGMCAAQTAAPEAKRNVKTCPEHAVAMEAVSLQRPDSGQLFFTFTIEQQANQPFKTYTPQLRSTLVDDKGDQWRAVKFSVPNVILPNAKTNATIRFERAVGGNESTAATISFRLLVDGNPHRACNVTFNPIAIS